MALFVVAYTLAFWLSERLYGSLSVPSPFWLPDSVLLCALLLAPKRRWWMFALAVWPIRLLVGAVPATVIWFQLFSILNDTLKGLASAWMLQRIVRRPIRLDTLGEFWIFLGVAAVALPALSALVAGPMRHLLGDPLWRATYQWFLGDALTQVIVTPALLYWCRLSFREPRARLVELTGVCAGLIAALYLAFVVEHAMYSPMLAYMPLPLLIWAAVRLRPFGTANALVLVAFVSMVGGAGGSGIFGASSISDAQLSIQLLLVLLGVTLLSLSILVVEREALRERAQDLSHRLLEAQDHERGRIARELHDDLAQRLVALHLEISHCGESERVPDSVRMQLKALALTASELCADVHFLSHRLHPATLDIVGLEASVRGLCREFSDKHPLEVRFRATDVPPQMGSDVGLCLFRVVQEALHNVVRHSRATEVDVELSHHGDRLQLSVADNGVGYDTQASNRNGGLGLVSMQERVRSVGGEFTIQSGRGRGMRIGVDIPVVGRSEQIGV